jgi:hypothetical protein
VSVDVPHSSAGLSLCRSRDCVRIIVAAHCDEISARNRPSTAADDVVAVSPLSHGGVPHAEQRQNKN